MPHYPSAAGQDLGRGSCDFIRPGRAGYPYRAYLLRCLLPTQRAYYHREFAESYPPEHFPCAASARPGSASLSLRRRAQVRARAVIMSAAGASARQGRRLLLHSSNCNNHKHINRTVNCKLLLNCYAQRLFRCPLLSPGSDCDCDRGCGSREIS